MPTAYLYPNATLINTNWSATGGSLPGVLADSNDGTYGEGVSLSNLYVAAVNDWSIPAGAVVVAARTMARLDCITAGNWRLISLSNGTTSDWTVRYEIPITTTVTDYYTDWYYRAFSQTEINNFSIALVDSAIGSYAEGGFCTRARVEVVYADAPSAPIVLSPTSSVTDTRRPIVTWSHNAGADGGSQTKREVKIFSSAQYGAGGFDPSTSTPTQSSGISTTTSSSWTPGVSLANGTTYRAYVRTAATTNGVDQWSPWGYSQFTISITLPVPTGLFPENGSTKTSSTPSIAAAISTTTDSIPIKRQWNVASDSGFTTNLQTYTDPTATTSKSGSITFPFINRLPQGTWYIRCRTVDIYDQTSSWTSTNTFTVAHAPSTQNRTPTGNVSLEYDGSNNDVEVQWDFIDPDTLDYQESFEAELWKESAPGSPIQSTKTASGNEFYNFTGLDSSWKDTELRWRVKVYDQDDVASAWSSEQAFYLRDLPTCNITDPVGAGGATEKDPIVSWSFSASAGRTQASFRVVVTDTDAEQVVADSGVVYSTEASWAMPSVISVGVDYQIDLYVTDSSGLSNTDTDTFTATYADTTVPSYVADTSQYTDSSYVLIDWSGATEDTDCQYWRVYRRLDGEVTWTLIHQTNDATPRAYYDYACPANIGVQYAMTQTALQVGDPIESAFGIRTLAASSLASSFYWLTCPEDPGLNVRLYNVKDDQFSDEQEMAETNLVNRGRQVSYGTRFGQRGSLTVQLWDRPEITAREQRRLIEELRDSGLKVYLKSPFGDSWPVALPAARVTRIPGIGLIEAAEMSLDYVEVSV